MKRLTTAGLACGILLMTLTGCTLSLFNLPTQQPTPVLFPTTTATSALVPLLASATPTTGLVLPSPTLTTTPATATPTLSPATVTPIASPVYVILTGSPSGPYAVIGVLLPDTLNIRSAPGMDSPITGSFAGTATNVMRTGPSAWIDPDLWVEVQKPGGGSGWVNSTYLTETVSSATFCADSQVTTLLTDLGTALRNSDGEKLATLVSPKHDMTVYLWRNGTPIPFDQAHAKWVFESTFEHNWGAAPGSGQNTVGAFHVVVLPRLLEVYNAAYTLGCNDVSKAGPVIEPWPLIYTNINFYSLHKPGTPGVDLDYRTWLVGVEYVQGKPYIFALIDFQWAP